MFWKKICKMENNYKDAMPLDLNTQIGLLEKREKPQMSKICEKLERAGMSSSNSEQHSIRPSVLDLMKVLYELLKNQEEFENKILAIETQCYIQYVSENCIVDRCSELDMMLLRSDLEEVIDKKNCIKDQLADRRDELRRLNDMRIKYELDITVELVTSIEKRLESVLKDRKKIYKRIREMKETRLHESRRENRNDNEEENPQSESFPLPNTSILRWKEMDIKFTPIKINKLPPEKPICLHFEHLAATGLRRDRSCCINSLIQCLSHSPGLSEYFNENIYLNDFLAYLDDNTYGPVTNEFAQLIKGLWCGRYKSISPRDFKAAVSKDPRAREIDNFAQLDARKFLTFLLQRLHKDLEKESNVCEEKSSNPGENAWNTAMENKTSIISDLFYGQYRSTIQCTKCRFEIVTYEMFQSINISLGEREIIVRHKTPDIEDYLASYFSQRVIKAWQCPCCKVSRDGVKKLKIERLPSIVIICLDRNEKNVTFLEENNSSIDIVIKETLSLKPYVIEDSTCVDFAKNFEKYGSRLYAISNLDIITGQCHYVSCCRIREKWYLYNDEDVSVIEEDKVKMMNRNACVLFYEQNSFVNQ